MSYFLIVVVCNDAQLSKYFLPKKALNMGVHLYIDSNLHGCIPKCEFERNSTIQGECLLIICMRNFFWFLELTLLQMFHCGNCSKSSPLIMVISAPVSITQNAGTPSIVTLTHWGLLPQFVTVKSLIWLSLESVRMQGILVLYLRIFQPCDGDLPSTHFQFNTFVPMTHRVNDNS